MVVAGLAVILFTASWRFVVRSSGFSPQGARRINALPAKAGTPNDTPALATARPVKEGTGPTTMLNFEADFLSLLAPLEANTNDPFAREKRAAAFQARIDTIGSLEMPAAFEAIALMRGRESTETRQDLLARVAQRWAELDPRAAAAEMGQLAGDSSEACRRVATVWARTDAREALAWAENLNDVGAREGALTAIAQENAAIDPITTLTLLPQIGTADDGVVDDAMRSWVERDPGAAMDWAERVGASPLREEVFAGVAAALSESDPVEAARIAIREVKGAVQRDNLVLGIVQRWGAKDFSAAEAWVNDFPEGDLRERALRELKRVRQGSSAQN